MREPPDFWYKPQHPLGALLAPLGWLYGLFAVLRRGAYRAGLRRSWQVGRPVVVIGNLCVGGAGKTPLVIAVAKLLARQGVRAGIVCRGYGEAPTGGRGRFVPTATRSGSVTKRCCWRVGPAPRSPPVRTVSPRRASWFGVPSATSS